MRHHEISLRWHSVMDRDLIHTPWRIQGPPGLSIFSCKSPFPV